MAANVDEQIDYGQSNRKDEYRFVLVDPFSLKELNEIEVEPESSSLTFGYYTDNKVQGNLTLKAGSYIIDGYEKMIRIYHKTIIDQESFEYCLCTLFVDSASETSLYKNTEVSLSCYGALWRFTQDVIIQDFYRQTGYNVVNEMRELVEIDGGKFLVGAGVNENRLHSRDIRFELGTSRAEVLNTIAGWIDCEITVDPYGYIRLDKYVSPENKAVSYTFVEGEKCTYVAGYDLSNNRNEPINRVKVYYSRESKEDDDPYPLTDSYMIDSADTNEFSYKRCGRRRTQIIKVDTPCSTDELRSAATKYLNENNYAIQYIQIEHVGIPYLLPGMNVQYINSKDSENPINIIGMITEMSISSLNPGRVTRSKIRIVRNNA